MLTGLRRKFDELERLYGFGPDTGRVPGTTLSRCLLPKDEGGGVGWCLGMGDLDQPKRFFYSASLVGVLAKARNAVRRGDSAPPAFSIVLGPS